MTRADAIAVAADYVHSCGDGCLLVATLGYPARELYARRDMPNNFYMLGSMGLASSIGLGIALFTHKRVIVLDGDGALLMNLGTLATIAHHAPPHYSLVVLDNKHYASTGGQETYTARKTDLAAMAKAAGIRCVVTVKTANGLHRALRRTYRAACVVVAKVQPGNDTVPVIPLTPTMIRNRFMNSVLAGGI